MRTTRSSSSMQAGWFSRCFCVIISPQIFRRIREHSDMHIWRRGFKLSHYRSFNALWLPGQRF